MLILNDPYSCFAAAGDADVFYPMGRQQYVGYPCILDESFHKALFSREKHSQTLHTQCSCMDTVYSRSASDLVVSSGILSLHCGHYAHAAVDIVTQQRL